MNKMRAAGDEADGWAPRTAEEIKEAGLWDAVDTASREIENFDSAMIFKEGRDWTQLWHELGLSRQDGELEVDDAVAERLLKAAERNAEAYDLLLELAASLIDSGKSLPTPWRYPLAAKLKGRSVLQRPKPTGASPKIWSRNFMLNHVARLLRDRYDGLSRNLTRNKETKTTAATDILFHAMKNSSFGELAFGTINNQIFDSDPKNGFSEKNCKNHESIRVMAIDSLFDEYPE